MASRTEQNQAGSEPNFVLALLAVEDAAVLNWDLTPVDFFGCAGEAKNKRLGCRAKTRLLSRNQSTKEHYKNNSYSGSKYAGKPHVYPRQAVQGACKTP
jgi:hypothetical protein